MTWMDSEAALLRQKALAVPKAPGSFLTLTAMTEVYDEKHIMAVKSGGGVRRLHIVRLGDPGQCG
jgi:hypothetical protein